MIGFDIIVGNPPFVNAIEGAVDTRTKALLMATAPTLGGTADLAFHFVRLSHSLASESRGRVALVQPKTILNADAIVTLREELNKARPLALCYVPQTATFFEGVSAYVCLIVLGPSDEVSVADADELGSAEWQRGKIMTTNWWRDIQVILGHIAPLSVGDMQPLGEAFDVAASMTTGDAYVIKPHVLDDKDGEGLCLVTTGLIDPFECLWGTARCRYLGKVFQHPRIAKHSTLPAALNRRLSNASRPKLLIAGLADRLEVFFDSDGKYCGAVSTFSIFHEGNSLNLLSQLCEWLNSDAASDLLRGELGAASLSGGYMTLKKKTLMKIPVPRFKTKT